MNSISRYYHSRANLSNTDCTRVYVSIYFLNDLGVSYVGNLHLSTFIVDYDVIFFKIKYRPHETFTNIQLFVIFFSSLASKV